MREKKRGNTECLSKRGPDSAALRIGEQDLVIQILIVDFFYA